MNRLIQSICIRKKSNSSRINALVTCANQCIIRNLSNTSSGKSRNTPTSSQPTSSSGFKGIDILQPDLELEAPTTLDENGETIVLPIRNQMRPKLGIVAFGKTSYQVNNYLARQSVILLPNQMYLWSPKSIEDITIDSLRIFEHITPRLEVLFIGCGRTMQQIPIEIHEYFKQKGIILDVGSSRDSASTFNVMSLEGRSCAAALLTMEPWNEWTDNIKEEFK